MSKVNLHEFKGKDLYKKLGAASDFLREHPGSTLIIDPGDYILTTEKARASQEAVMNGKFGDIPQMVMFRPDYDYDRGLDLNGVKGCRIEAYGVRFLVDGFMEPVSVRNCKNAEILGLTIDTVRKPFSRGKITEKDGERIKVLFGEDYPITPEMPHMRACICDEGFNRLEKLVDLLKMEYTDEHCAFFETRGLPENCEGREIYIWHTYHSRPAILIENAEKTHLKDITVNSHPGMGITAHASKDIFFERLKIVPANGECMSTNTDATHIASCRGNLRYDGCFFAGQGDDALNVHTYYHNIISAEGSTVVSKACPPDGTHTQAPDLFKKGDTLIKVSDKTLAVADTFKLVEISTDENGVSTCVLDHEFGETEGFSIADKDALPRLEVINCTMKDHLARGALIKTPYALMENCTIERTFDYAVKIAPEASWKEGIGTDDVTVRGCRMIGCDHRTNYCGGIFMYSESEDRSENIHGKITVENCYIECPGAKNAMILNNVSEIEEKDNTIIK